MANVILEIPETEVAEFEATWQQLAPQMRAATASIEKDREQIDRLKAEIQEIGEQTRTVLEELEVQVGL